MILSASQPYFAPYPGFFYKAHLSDLFVILDDVQFPRGTTWISRNRFKNHLGTLWMTIPVWKKGLGLQTIRSVRICREGRWAKKHLETIKTAYARAPYLREHLPFFEKIFSGDFERLLDLNMEIIRHVIRHLGIQGEVLLLSELGVGGTGDRRLIEICRRTGATRFLAQRPARKFLNEEVFREAGISLDFFTPPVPVYPQLWGEFLPNLSVLDLLLNCGPKSREILLGE
ncbi:MAG: WbqC family protein [Deltaproteobacteria bacterium]|nr:WbqC family protein [Deltaproteobacteria bacterium]MBW2128260.1 WbqC family protein [Deltaproteobacteria bacterium]